ncbi:hypothetical protein NDU88_009893 [Pleurodeles waltl]|uniref:Uncharacterized protein n=1 Tax=Pleurodeles waltl TaxID=8319 RepID=A0AAV7QSV4_PLEWA|nr:hypothetical protein NDU88_009893 [Pleurodeles waltl]
MAADKVPEALHLLREVGRLDMLREGVEAVLACSSSREPDERQAVRRRGGGRSKGRAGGAVLKGRGRALPLRGSGFRVSPPPRGLGSHARGSPRGARLRREPAQGAVWPWEGGPQERASRTPPARGLIIGRMKGVAKSRAVAASRCSTVASNPRDFSVARDGGCGPLWQDGNVRGQVGEESSGWCAGSQALLVGGQTGDGVTDRQLGRGNGRGSGGGGARELGLE